MKAYARMTLAERWSYKTKGSPTRPGKVPKPERSFVRCVRCGACLYENQLAGHDKRCPAAPR